MGDGFQFIDIIFFALVAAFLVLRLRSVLGRRDGHEGGYRDPFKPAPAEEAADEKVIRLPGKTPPADADSRAAGADARTATPLEAGLTQIKLADPSFDADEFAHGARAAFEMILGAYSAGDTFALKPLLSPDVFTNFSASIRDREKAGETLEETLVGIKSAEVTEAFMEGRVAQVTVTFVSQQISATRNKAGEVIDGDPNAIIDVTDFWTFARDTRSRDPNWTLVATQSAD